MRVIAGTAKSLPLKTPEGKDTRPTTDRIKETLFNVMQPYIGDSIFIDLFSGSGGIGIEALSRGAKKAYFAEKDKKALYCIRKNLEFTGFSNRATVIAGDVLYALDKISEEEADIIFMDPPYDMGWEQKALKKLQDAEYVTDNTIIVAEASLKTDFSYLESCGFTVIKEKRYKTNKHMFMKRKEMYESSNLPRKF